MEILAAQFRRIITAVCMIIAFRNWPHIASVWLQQESINSTPADITAVTRVRVRLTVPATAPAMWPLIEVYALDIYRLQRFDLTGLHVLDIGAHVGAFSTAVCATYRGTTVSAFEPTPETYRYLLVNIAQNGFGHRIEPFNTAVSAQGGPVHFQVGGHADSTNRILAEASPRTISVPSITLATVLTSARKRFDVCKLDCEGEEYDLVESTSPDAWDGVQLLLLEFHGATGRSQKLLLSRLVSLGFRLALQAEYASSEMAWLYR
jgi:FkbM family methyltransferase